MPQRTTGRVECGPTPGPWTHAELSDAIITARGVAVAEPPDGYDEDQWRMDAKLIAAAPELLALAREVEQLITRDSDDLGFHLRVVPMRIETVRALRAAIAKAEGSVMTIAVEGHGRTRS